MEAKRISQEPPPPPDLIQITMTEEDARLLLNLASYNVRIPRVVSQDDLEKERNVRALLSNIVECLVGAKVR